MISVIMPAYNEEKFIKEAVESVLNQSYKDLELIVVDDGSTDKTLNILKSLEKNEYRLKIISLKKSGKVKAINQAVSSASGNWFVPMAADDIMEPNILEIWMNIARSYDSSDEKIVLCSKIREFSKDSEYKRFNGLVLPKGDKFYVTGANFIMSERAKKIVYPIPEQFPNEDSWIRNCCEFLDFKIIGIPAIAMNYRRHANNSINPNAVFKDFNIYYHKRAVVACEFLKTFKNELSRDNIVKLENKIKIEEQRYSGKSVQILFKNNCAMKEKIRNLFFSKKSLYKIKLFFEKKLIGRF